MCKWEILGLIAMPIKIVCIALIRNQFPYGGSSLQTVSLATPGEKRRTTLRTNQLVAVGCK